MNNVIFNDEMNDKILSGITKLYEAVSCTLGPSGRNVIISKDNGKPFITNDGVTIAKEIELEDKSDTRIMIEKFVDENPEAVALLLRNWINEDWGAM